MALQNEHYFLSSQVKVFPCSSRGQANNMEIDPGARIPTEYNLTNLSVGVFIKDNTYVESITRISSRVYNLTCVIYGYRFTITDIAPEDIANKYFYINLKDVDNGAFVTKVLRPAITDSTISNLDYQGVFYGLYITDAPSSVFGTGFQLIGGTSHIAAPNPQYLLPSIASGTGTKSVALNSGKAGGSNATAAGIGTIANGGSSFIVGKYNSADSAANALFAVGNGTLSSKQDAFVVTESDAHFNVPVTHNAAVTVKSPLVIQDTDESDGFKIYRNGVAVAKTGIEIPMPNAAPPTAAVGLYNNGTARFKDAVTLDKAPSADTDATNKAYVDSKVNTHINVYTYPNTSESSPATVCKVVKITATQYKSLSASALAADVIYLITP